MALKISNRLRALLKPSTRVAVLTGAGVSQESGVPTFRDKDGLWQKFKPEELANVEAFLANPELVWSWYEHRRKIIREVQPNLGHNALAHMETFFASFTLITQNVDGLHARAGSKNILEVHGNIMRSLCMRCKAYTTAESGAALCAHCSGRLRPDVVWFGETLPAEVFAAAENAARTCDLFFSIGTSGAVFPAAGLPLLAKETGAYVVEINPQRTEISRYMDEVLMGPSATVLPDLAVATSLTDFS